MRVRRGGVVTLLTSTMNSLLVATNRKAEKRVDGHRCFCCKRVFCSHRALRGHLRVHREEIMSSRSCNNPGSSGNNSRTLMDSQPENSSGKVRKMLPLSIGKASPLASSKRFCSDKTGPVDTTMALGDELVNAKSLSLQSLSLSSPRRSAGIHHSSHLFSTENAASNTIQPSLNQCAFSAAIISPSDLSLSLGANELFPFNAVGHQTWMDATLVSDGHASQNRPFIDLNKPAPLQSGMSDPFLVGSTQLLSSKGTGICFSGWGRWQCRGQYEVGQSSKSSALTLEGNKSPHFENVPDGANMMNPPKRPVMNFYPPVHAERLGIEEQFPFESLEQAYARLEMFMEVEEKSRRDLDLSLHL